MDWNTDGPNTVEVPEGTAKLLVCPVLLMLGIPGQKVHKARYRERLDMLHHALHVVGGDAETVDVTMELPDRTLSRVVGVRVYGKGPGTPKGEPDHRWEGPLAEFELPGERDRAQGYLEYVRDDGSTQTKTVSGDEEVAAWLEEKAAAAEVSDG